MDIDKILKKYKKELLLKFKKDSPNHIETDNIFKFINNEFDMKNKNEESEYNKIVNHLAHCNECNEEIQIFRDIIENEMENLSIKEGLLNKEKINEAFTEFKNRINSFEKKQKAAKKLARKFISEFYPKFKPRFVSAWEVISKIPKEVSLVLTKKEFPALGFTDSKQKADQILLFQILFTIKNIFDEIDETSSGEQINEKIKDYTEQNKLSKKIKNQLFEFILIKKKHNKIF